MKNLDLSLGRSHTGEAKIKSVYFIGIGGIGISALAKFAKVRGMEVSGVNDEEGKTVDSLKELGINVMSRGTLDTEKDLPEADLYVYSDAWIHRGPEILEMARNTGKPVLSYAEALGFFVKEYKVIAISGTHGKTTTTAMVAEILTDAGFDPTVIVGSFMKKFDPRHGGAGSNFRAGKSKYLVVEADEYNRHMLYLNPYIGAITNIEADHLDCYKDLDDIKNAFDKFLSQSENKILNYKKYIEKVPKLSIPGEHNRQNAGLALAVAEILGIDESISKKSLENFQGTWRRLEKRGETKDGTIIYDDYAHHPTEVRASIEALRELYPIREKKITIVFQPHLYSRTKALFNDFAKCFKGADRIILLPIYFAREDKDESISSGKLAEAICLAGEKAIAFTDFELAEEYLKGQTFGKDDVFVTMGAGESYKVAEEVFPLSTRVKLPIF
ncbi:MAG: cyanophycin synthetase [Patescibacteria group bacterium]